PGVTLRPIELIDGGHEVNEVFFEDVRVPAENLVGEENRGWDYAKFLLGNERTGIARVGATKKLLAQAKDYAREITVDGTPLSQASFADGGSDVPDWARVATPTYLNYRKVSIYGGSNEVQRTIIAGTILGL